MRWLLMCGVGVRRTPCVARMGLQKSWFVSDAFRRYQRHCRCMVWRAHKSTSIVAACDSASFVFLVPSRLCYISSLACDDDLHGQNPFLSSIRPSPFIVFTLCELVICSPAAERNHIVERTHLSLPIPPFCPKLFNCCLSERGCSIHSA